MVAAQLSYNSLYAATYIINPRRACATRVTVLGLCVCVCVCYSTSHFSLLVRLHDKSAIFYSAENAHAYESEKRMRAVESDSVKLARKAKDKLHKACERAPETRERTLHRQEQNRMRMASMRESALY